MTELTDEVLAELERLHGEATPGPWKVQRRYSNECEIVPRVTCNPDDDRGCGWIADIIGAPYLGHKTTLPNANLIAASRNHLPFLIAAARRYREYRNKAAAYHDALMMVSRAKEVSMGLDDVIKLAKDELEEIEGQQ